MIYYLSNMIECTSFDELEASKITIENKDNILLMIKKEIEKENNFFKMISLYEIYYLSKTFCLYPGLKYTKIFKKFYSIFINYCHGKEEKKNYKIIDKIINRMNNNFPYFKLINNLEIKGEEEKQLVLAYLLINKVISNLLLIICLIKKEINVIFEYNSLNGIPFNAIQFFNDITEKIKINNNKILHIKYNNNNLSFNFEENNKNLKFEILSEYEIYTIKNNGDKNEIKIINIKHYLNNEDFFYNKMDDEIESKFQEIEKEFIIQKEINNKQEAKINKLEKDKISQEKEINFLKKKVSELEANMIEFKGRFIFKAFLDYIYLLFNVNVNLKSNEKINQLRCSKELDGYYYDYIYQIAIYMKKLYYKQTDQSHYLPSSTEIKTTILNCYNKQEDEFIYEMFERLKPEKIIRQIIEKNNNLTKLLISSEYSNSEKDKQKLLIISEINKIMSDKIKNESISIIKEIIDNCENKI